MLALHPVSDVQALLGLYADPYIARVGHDHRPAAPIDHPAAQYLEARASGCSVGAFLAIKSSRIDWDVHALLKRKALPHSRALGRLFLGWCFSHPELARVTALVIQGLEAARNYCARLGFVYEGFKRGAVMVGGSLVGLHMLGLTRTEWEAQQ